jgi:hypothetical protein
VTRRPSIEGACASGRAVFFGDKLRAGLETLTQRAWKIGWIKPRQTVGSTVVGPKSYAVALLTERLA